MHHGTKSPPPRRFHLTTINLIFNKYININQKTPFISNYGYDIWEKIIKKNTKHLEVLGGGSTIKYTKNDHASNNICQINKPFMNVNTTAKTSRIPKGAKYTKTRKNSNSQTSKKSQCLEESLIIRNSF